MSEPVVEARSLVKRFSVGPETITVLSGLDLVVSAGESVAITGQSGTGKTTLLHIIGGLDKPDSGSISLGGTEISSLEEERLATFRGTYIGFVFQFHYLLKDFTAEENVVMPAYIQGMSRRKAAKRAKELLSQVGLYDRCNHYPHQLSGGERQRVALARALVNEPSVLLADEPTGNLDPDHSQEVEDLVFALPERLGNSLIVVSHDPEIAARADRHTIMAHGRLEQE